MTRLFFFYIILIFCVIDLPADTYGVLHGLAVVFCVVRWRWFVSETFFFFFFCLSCSSYRCSRKCLLWPFSLISCCHLSPQVMMLLFFPGGEKNLSTRHTRNRKQTQTRVGFFLFLFFFFGAHDVSHVATFCVNISDPRSSTRGFTTTRGRVEILKFLNINFHKHNCKIVFQLSSNYFWSTTESMGKKHKVSKK